MRPCWWGKIMVFNVSGNRLQDLLPATAAGLTVVREQAAYPSPTLAVASRTSNMDRLQFDNLI
jgi:hypothetical protein